MKRTGLFYSVPEAKGLTVGELHSAIESTLRDYGPQTLEGLYRRVEHTGVSHFDFAGAVRGLVGAERIHFDGKMREIELEDQGQDFTSFVIDDENVILEARPFQSWVWRGFRIQQKRIRRGMHLTLYKPLREDGKAKVIRLRYPVVRVSTRSTGIKIKVTEHGTR